MVQTNKVTVRIEIIDGIEIYHFIEEGQEPAIFVIVNKTIGELRRDALRKIFTFQWSNYRSLLKQFGQLRHISKLVGKKKSSLAAIRSHSRFSYKFGANELIRRVASTNKYFRNRLLKQVLALKNYVLPFSVYCGSKTKFRHKKLLKDFFPTYLRINLILSFFDFLTRRSTHKATLMLPRIFYTFTLYDPSGKKLVGIRTKSATSTTDLFFRNIWLGSLARRKYWSMSRTLLRSFIGYIRYTLTLEKYILNVYIYYVQIAEAFGQVFFGTYSKSTLHGNRNDWLSWWRYIRRTFLQLGVHLYFNHIASITRNVNSIGKRFLVNRNINCALNSVFRSRKFDNVIELKRQRLLNYLRKRRIQIGIMAIPGFRNLKPVKVMRPNQNRILFQKTKSTNPNKPVLKKKSLLNKPLSAPTVNETAKLLDKIFAQHERTTESKKSYDTLNQLKSNSRVNKFSNKK